MDSGSDFGSSFGGFGGRCWVILAPKFENSIKNDLKKMISVGKITSKRPQNGSQNRPTTNFGGRRGPQEGPNRIQESLRDRIWTIFDNFFGSNFDPFWIDLEPNLDRFATMFLRTISSPCKLLKHLF